MNPDTTSSPYSTVTRWVLALRVKTLPASLMPVILGSALTIHSVSYSWLVFCCTLIAAVSIQIVSNLANDLFDFKKGADTAARIGPVRVSQAGLVTESEMKLAILSVVTIAVCSGGVLVFRGGLPILGIGICSLFFAVLYTAGPYALAYKGLGELFVFIFFGPVAVAGTAYLQSLSLQPNALLLGCSLGSISSALLVVNNLRDYEEDLRARKQTLIVRFGMQFGRILYTFLLVLAPLFALLLPLLLGQSALYELSWLYLIPARTSVQTIAAGTSTEIASELEKTGKLLSLFTLLCVGACLIGENG